MESAVLVKCAGGQLPGSYCFFQLRLWL